MTFDPQAHQDRQTLILAATVRRRLKGLPEEKNISVLYNEICTILELPVIEISSKDANHFPAPHEMTDATNRFVVPRKDCPSCPDFEEKQSMILTAICRSCEDAEGGKYKTMWQCQRCKYKEKSEKVFIQWLNELGIEIPNGPKVALGIKTITDEGLK